MQPYKEPEPHIDDTSPSLPIRPADLNLTVDPHATQSWRRTAGWLSLLGAAVLTFAAALLLLLPDDRPEPLPTQEPAETQQVLSITDVPPPTQDVAPPVVIQGPTALPTLDPLALQDLLLTPVQVLGADLPGAFNGARYDPFTTIPDRPRSEFLTYVAVRGDTISGVARRFGLADETIAWCNKHSILLVLRPGDELNIAPTDGACHTVIGTQGKTITDIARDYGVSDPYVIIDSPYNNLFGISPETVLPSGTRLFIPGGEGPLITWNPGYVEETTAGSGSGGGGGITYVTFAPGQAGSCGRVPVAGGSFWTNPLPNGTWIRGYYPGHTGIDLAAAEGTPIYAANGGPVLFAGFSAWGYGNTVVLAHGGSLSTLYAHMSSLAVRCGDNVVAGQIIGYVGSTGNSTGPHLHFEIRFNGQPHDPTGTPGIGW